MVGASAGEVEALRSFIAALPGSLDAVVCVVLHNPRAGTSALPHILGRAGRLPVRHATDGCRPKAGTVCVAPLNFHVLVTDGRLRLSRDSASSRGSTMTAERYTEVGRDTDDAGQVIRRLIVQLGSIEDKTLVADGL